MKGVADSLGSLGQVTSLLPSDIAAVVTSVANAAFVDAMRIGVLAGIGIVGLTIVIALLTMPRTMRAGQAEFGENENRDGWMPSAADQALQTGD